MLDLGQVLKEGLALANGSKKSLVLGEVPSVLLHVLAFDSYAAEQAEAEPEHSGHAAKKADLIRAESPASTGHEERSPSLPVHTDRDRLAPTDTGDQDTRLLAACRREDLGARVSRGPPARGLDARSPQEGAGVGAERGHQAFKAVVDSRELIWRGRQHGQELGELLRSPTEGGGHLATVYS